MNSFNSEFFDIIHDRNVAGDIKYSPAPGVKNVIPMWIADMDFKIPPAVEEALAAASHYGIFGYTQTDEEYDVAVAAWYKKRMSWNVKPEWILKTPGVIFAVAAAVQALTDVGDGVMICQPAYYPFANIIPANNRKLVVSQLRLTDGRYEIDFDDFEEKIIRDRVKIFLLCSPHNPVGRVWTREELSEIGRICCKRNVYIVSDEIHSDFVFEGRKHVPIASLFEEFSDITVTCTSPTKTFNLAGLQSANIIISNCDVRRKVYKACRATGYGNINTMAIAATKAAYKYAEPWLDALLFYLQENVSILQKFSDENRGKISLIRPEGTYLMWLDCRKIGLNDFELEELFTKKAGVRLHSGAIFGAGGSGFVRMNIACPKSVLLQALKKIGSVL